ncbi:MAG: hypothetical protein ABR497_08320, partial [Kiritimatiellia bacterium]
MTRLSYSFVAWFNVALILLLLPAGALAQTNRFVVKDNPNPVPPYTSWEDAAPDIQLAVNAAGDGDTVWIAPGHYIAPAVPVEWNGDNVVFIDKPLTLRSSNNVPDSVIIDGGGVNRGIAADLSGTAVIVGLTVSNCYPALAGGGLRTGGSTTLTVSNCVVTSNQSDGSGGGIYAAGPAAILSSRIEGNMAAVNGGGISHVSDLTIANSYIGYNDADSRGGGVYNSANILLLVTDTIIDYNRANRGGGGIYSQSGDNVVSNSVLRGNQSFLVDSHENDGNAMYLRQNRAVLYNVLIVANHGATGTAIYMHVPTGTPSYDLRLYNCTLAYNTGSGQNLIRFRRNPGAQSYFHMYNTILYYNSRPITIPTSYTDVYFSNCCYDPARDNLDAHPGGDHTTLPPNFFDGPNGNYHLVPPSPC